MNFITGEKFEINCDMIIGEYSDINYNPLIKNTCMEKILILSNHKINNSIINNPKNIFVYTHIIHQNFKTLLNILELFNNKFYLFLHNSDYSFDETHLLGLKKIKNLCKIFTQNINIPKTDYVIPIPIGIPNQMWSHGNPDILNKIINENIEKSNLIYFNFKINTNKKIREHCYNIVSKTNIKWYPTTDYKNYLKILKCHKFAICPQGNGIDTHRMWECFYLKVIPICIKCHLTEFYANYFPILLLEKWEDLDVNNLEENYISYSFNNYKLLNYNEYMKYFS